MQRVDVHHHYLPPFYVQALKDGGGDPSGWATPDWTVEKDLQFSKDEGIAYSFLSITAPGPEIVPRDKQAQFCRQANDHAAALCSASSASYGFFATIPNLLDVAAAQEEIKYALDVLKADGVTLYTRYGSNYLGHPDFQSIWDLLNSRGAVVFVHPTHPVDTSLVSPSLPQPMIDYPHETTRTAVDLIISGTMRRYPDAKVILSHAGGTLPWLAMRPAMMLPYLASSATNLKDGGPAAKDRMVVSFLEDARRFYFDTALSAGPLTLGLLKEFAQADHILFGSDYPYAPAPVIEQMDKLLDEYGKNGNESFAQSTNVGAAMKLFPRLSNLIADAQTRI
ncbi:uncharacterized protein PG998_003712 [Apiospora kogelbergensis]|uniref:uncharacterized protein n=1 Tax=Apiospora kogelbergensis TaxID=1337665 RepID=UPI00312F88C6